MTRDMLRPKWLFAHLAAAVLAFGFIFLGQAETARPLAE